MVLQFLQMQILPIGKDPIGKDNTSIIPNGIKFWVELEKGRSEIERIL